jgi:hypothetical protein
LHRTRKALNYWIFWFIRWKLYWLKLLKAISCYGSHTGLYNKSVEYSTWISPSFAGSEVIWVHICFFLELCSSRSWWRTQGVRRYNSWCTYFWKPFWICPWDMPVSLIRLSSGKQQNFQSGDYSPQVPDYQDLWIFICWITKILFQMEMP